MFTVEYIVVYPDNMKVCSCALVGTPMSGAGVCITMHADAAGITAWGASCGAAALWVPGLRVLE